MKVFAIHDVADPEAFWSGKLDLPTGTDLQVVVPSADGTRGVCIFETDSIATVKNLIDGAAGEISTNEYYAVNEGNALGLPA